MIKVWLNARKTKSKCFIKGSSKDVIYELGYVTYILIKLFRAKGVPDERIKTYIQGAVNNAFEAAEDGEWSEEAKDG
jgi:hypothetical protein